MAEDTLEAESARENPTAASVAFEATNELYSLGIALHELEALVAMASAHHGLDEDQQAAISGLATLATGIRSSVKALEARFSDLHKQLIHSGNVAEFKKPS